MDGSSDTSVHTECFLGGSLTVRCFLFLDLLLVLSWRRRSKQVCLTLSGFSPGHRFRCTGCVSWPCAEGSRAVASVCPFRFQVLRARWGRGLCGRLVDGFPCTMLSGRCVLLCVRLVSTSSWLLCHLVFMRRVLWFWSVVGVTAVVILDRTHEVLGKLLERNVDPHEKSCVEANACSEFPARCMIDVDFLVAVEHGLIPARVRSEWAKPRKAGHHTIMHSVWTSLLLSLFSPHPCLPLPPTALWGLCLSMLESLGVCFLRDLVVLPSARK